MKHIYRILLPDVINVCRTSTGGSWRVTTQSYYYQRLDAISYHVPDGSLTVLIVPYASGLYF